MNNAKRLSVESFLVILLMILLAISIAVMIIQGSKSFNRMNDSKIKNEDARIAMSYINMMVKQNDVLNKIKLLDDFNAHGKTLGIYHTDEEEGLATYIYFKDGTLYEQYSDATDVLDSSASTAIINIDNITFKETASGKFEINYVFGEQKLTQHIHIRTGH